MLNPQVLSHNKQSVYGAPSWVLHKSLKGLTLITVFWGLGHLVGTTISLYYNLVCASYISATSYVGECAKSNLFCDTVQLTFIPISS